MLVPILRNLENAADRNVLDLNVSFFLLGDTTGGVPLRVVLNYGHSDQFD